MQASQAPHGTIPSPSPDAYRLVLEVLMRLQLTGFLEQFFQLTLLLRMYKRVVAADVDTTNENVRHSALSSHLGQLLLHRHLGPLRLSAQQAVGLRAT